MRLLIDAMLKAKKILIAGNGGLAAESEHFAAELMGKYAQDVYIPCIALTTNSSLITALANDIGFENVFSHQVEVLGQPGDVFIGMTTSKSSNVLKAIKMASGKGMVTVLVGGSPDASQYPNSTYYVPLLGEDVAEKQNYAIIFLHQLARKMKEVMSSNV